MWEGRYRSGLSPECWHWSFPTEDSIVRWILEHQPSTWVLSNKRYHQKTCRRDVLQLRLYFVCVLVCWDRSQMKFADIQWTDNRYACGAEWGAMLQGFRSDPCQWLAEWFGAGPLTLVCLIYPTCKVGVTILSTYLPHRGVVGIRAAALVWRFKPPGSGATRANFILHWASYMLGSAGKVTSTAGQKSQSLTKAVQTKHTQSQLGPSHCSLCLGWKNFGSSFANHHL